MNKEEILKIVSSFGYGGMYPIELSTLYDLTKDKICIEIGSFVGQSSYVMAAQAKKLVCIDLWHFNENFDFLLDEKSREHYKGLYKDKNIALTDPSYIFFQFKKRLSPFENKLIIIVEDSKIAHRYLNKEMADLVVIDGDHSYEGTYIDYLNYIDKLQIGGLFCFHDNGNSEWPGVAQAIKEILSKKILKIKNQVETLTICEKVY